jgi:hypothetical protein
MRRAFLCLAALAACGPEQEQEDRPAHRGHLIIVTTGDFADRSVALPRFIDDKQRRGFRVTVVTEADYGGEKLLGQPRAHRIRGHLQKLLADVEAPATHLLLVGDAHPEYGDVPMFTVWPRHEQPEDICLGAFKLDCRTCQTDELYANLTGDWDLNGNGRYGEHKLDDGPGGIDFTPDLVVGRIPVYFGDVAEGDRILQHALDYGDQTPAQASYRRRALFMAAYLYFKGQRLAASSVAQSQDGAVTTEWMVKNVVEKRPGLTYHRLYEREGVPSTFASEGALTQENATRELSRGYGLIYWTGHGLPLRVVRTIWTGDDDGDSAADDAELTAPPFLRAQDADRITPGQPGFAVAGSCEVGSADVPYNLSHSMLLAGALVGIVGSSSVTPGSRTASTPGSQGALDDQAFGSDNAAVLMMEGLLDGKSAAEAFARAKVTLGKSGSADAHAGRMMLNYFGDPTLTLDDTSGGR